MKQFIFILFSMVITINSQFAVAADQQGNDALTIKDTWIREAPPTMKVLAAFMVIHNSTANDIKISEITSPAFKRIEMHRTIVSEGMARMVQQEQLRIPAKSSITLEPGGYHLMLFNPEKPMKKDDKVMLTFKLDSGKTQTIEAIVRKGASNNGNHHHHH